MYLLYYSYACREWQVRQRIHSLMTCFTTRTADSTRMHTTRHHLLALHSGQTNSFQPPKAPGPAGAGRGAPLPKAPEIPAKVRHYSLPHHLPLNPPRRTTRRPASPETAPRPCPHPPLFPWGRTVHSSLAEDLLAVRRLYFTDPSFSSPQGSNSNPGTLL